MSVYLSIPLLLLIGILQTSAVPSLPVFHIKPDLMLIAVICWGVLRSPRQAMLWAFFGGLWIDLLGNTPLGASVISLSVVAFLTSVGESAWIDRNLFLVLLIIFIGTLIHSTVLLAVLEATQRHSDWTALFSNVVIPTAILNTVLAPIGYWILGRLYKRTRPMQELEW